MRQPKSQIHIWGRRWYNSGCASWSKALRARGWLVHTFDINDGQDLSSPAVQKHVFSLIRQADFIHSGLPCNTYTSALIGDAILRTREHPMGRPGLSSKQQANVELHNKLLMFMLRVIRFCRRKKIPLSLENPCSSKLWQTPLLRRESKDGTRCTVDFCAFHTRWRKRTTFLTWNTHALHSLNQYRCKFCKGCCQYSGCPHVQLEGSGPGGKAWTRIAQDYPVSLTRLISRLIDDQADLHDIRFYRSRLLA